MTKADAIRITVNTEGWDYIRQMLESRVEKAKLAALVNTEEQQVMELWRRAQVAFQLFNGLQQDIEQLLEN